MKRYTLQQRIEIIKIHYKNGENLAETVRKTKAFLGRHESPCRTAIKKLVNKFELLGQVNDVKHETRARRSRTIENIAVVAQSIEEKPALSIPRRSLELGIPKTSLYRILDKDLRLKSFKVDSEDPLKQAQSATAAACNLMSTKPEEKAKEAEEDGDNTVTDTEISELRKRVQDLTASLDKEKKDKEAIKSLAVSLNMEYERLTEEYSKLQKKVTVSGGEKNDSEPYVY